MDCRVEKEREAVTLISGARMIWHREEPSPITEKSLGNIPNVKPNLEKLDPLNSNHLVSSSQIETWSNSEIKESQKKITNVADVLARVKGKLLPAFLRERESIRLAKQVPAKAVLVQTFRAEAAPGLRGNVLEGEIERSKYPRAASIVLA